MIRTIFFYDQPNSLTHVNRVYPVDLDGANLLVRVVSIMRIDSGFAFHEGARVTISVTYNPPPYSRHRRRNALFVTPAIGASTTGVSTVSLPSFKRR